MLTNKSGTEFFKTIFLLTEWCNYHEVTIGMLILRIKGGEKYVSNTLPEEERTEDCKINDYSRSSNVNSLTYNGVETWLKPAIRSDYLTSISSAELLGERHHVCDNGQAVTVPLQNAKILLAVDTEICGCKLPRDATAHRKVSKLTTVAEVTAYDITQIVLPKINAVLKCQNRQRYKIMLEKNIVVIGLHLIYKAPQRIGLC